MPKPPPGDAKLRSLREQGAVNPRPQTVTDDLFTASEFFDPNDLVQVKYEMLRRVEKDGQSVTEAAVKFGFSRPSFYQAQCACAARFGGSHSAQAWTQTGTQAQCGGPGVRSADAT